MRQYENKKYHFEVIDIGERFVFLGTLFIKETEKRAWNTETLEVEFFSRETVVTVTYLKKPLFDTEKEYHVEMDGKKGIAIFQGFGRGVASGKIAACFNVTLENGTEWFANQLELDFIDEEIYVD